MNTEIYYFSATGNSLIVAKDLAGRVNGKVISIPSVIDRERITTGADVTGIVFPVYFASLGGSGIPFIVEKFIKKLDTIDSRYIFAVCTHSGGPFSTIKNMDDLLRTCGGKLAAGYTVKLGIPYSAGLKLKHILFHSKLESDVRKDNTEFMKLSKYWSRKLDEICDTVTNRKEGKLETTGPIARMLLSPYLAMEYRLGLARYRHLSGRRDSSFKELVPMTDMGFRYNEKCNGCGICARICPTDNIKLVDKKPVWQHHCESCYACFQWCPRAAIGGDTPRYEKKYHHPAVKLKDMLIRK